MHIIFILSTSKLLHKLFQPLAINQINKVESFFWEKVFFIRIVHGVYVVSVAGTAGGGGSGDDVGVFVERLYFFSRLMLLSEQMTERSRREKRSKKRR